MYQLQCSMPAWSLTPQSMDAAASLLHPAVVGEAKLACCLAEMPFFMVLLHQLHANTSFRQDWVLLASVGSDTRPQLGFMKHETCLVLVESQAVCSISCRAARKDMTEAFSDI